ncbi:MAG: hypothetical protein HFH68_04510 [Lachnospiraceae bacterium]|nr:hypothetical protein [Lachnospiraceae bacterium]
MKKRMFAAALIISMVLTGCASVPELSDEDNQIISQYIAGAVLNNSERYGYSFNYDKSVLEPTPKPTPVPTLAPAPEPENTPGSSGTQGKPGTGSQGNSGSTGNNGGTGSGVSAAKSVSPGELYNIPGISISPLSVVTKKDIRTSFSSISADEGKKLVIVSFLIKNNSNKAQKAAFVKKNISYSITIGGKSYGNAMLTIAEGDLSSFNEKIAAGEKKKGVLIFQADSSVKVKDVAVKAVKGNKETTFNIKK